MAKPRTSIDRADDGAPGPGDPYGHGLTCDCERCMAWSEGFEAGRDAPNEARALPDLATVTAFVESTWVGLRRAIPPSGGAYVVGLIHGLFETDTAKLHLRALDAQLRLSAKPTKTHVVTYLRVHGIADYRPRSGIALITGRYDDGDDS